MQFKGLWKFEGADETLEITSLASEEQYTFEFSDLKKADEKVSIFISNDRYARLARSKVFGRADIFILDKDTFLIDDQKFTRINKNLL